MTLTQSFDEWIEQCRQESRERGMQEGMQQGIRDGMARVLGIMLSSQFGPLPPEVASKIASSPAEQIDAWADRLLSASSLDEIFGPRTL